MSWWHETRLHVVSEPRQQKSAWQFNPCTLHLAGVPAWGFSPAGVSQDHRLWPGRRPNGGLPPFHSNHWWHQVLPVVLLLQSTSSSFLGGGFPLYSRGYIISPDICTEFCALYARKPGPYCAVYCLMQWRSALKLFRKDSCCCPNRDWDCYAELTFLLWKSNSGTDGTRCCMSHTYRNLSKFSFSVSFSVKMDPCCSDFGFLRNPLLKSTQVYLILLSASCVLRNDLIQNLMSQQTLIWCENMSYWSAVLHTSHHFCAAKLSSTGYVSFCCLNSHTHTCRSCWAMCLKSTMSVIHIHLSKLEQYRGE